VFVITERALTTNHLPDEKRLMAVCKTTRSRATKKAASTEQANLMSPPPSIGF